jgi:hypothetical protein
VPGRFFVYAPGGVQRRGRANSTNNLIFVRAVFPRRAGKCVPMSFNPADFLHHVDDLDMTLDAKLDLIEVVGRIMESFVDRAFGESSEQILHGIRQCEATISQRGELNSRSRLTSTFNEAGQEEPAEEAAP